MMLLYIARFRDSATADRHISVVNFTKIGMC